MEPNDPVTPANADTGVRHVRHGARSMPLIDPGANVSVEGAASPRSVAVVPVPCSEKVKHRDQTGGGRGHIDGQVFVNKAHPARSQDRNPVVRLVGLDRR